MSEKRDNPLTPADLRRRTGLTQVQFATLIGKTPSTITKWEARSTMLIAKPSEIKRICEAYQCTLDELIEAFEGIQTQSE